MNAIESVRWENDQLWIIDQTLLPGTLEYIELKDVEAVWHAIRRLAVRGAPAIGITAAYGLVLGIKTFRDESVESIMGKAREVSSYLKSSRPTAVNLNWALDRILSVLSEERHENAASVVDRAEREAVEIHRQDKEVCRAIGQNGAELFSEPVNVLTHCNTGGLATGQFGTAFSVIYHLHQKGNIRNVWVDETRPLLQGARLTTWELLQADIPFRLITDSMAGQVMKERQVDLIVVGTDRVAANGDTANKIGTYSLAVLANYHRIPLYIAAPVSSIDFSLSDGSQIPIEERSPEELTMIGNKTIAPENCPVYNPAFDVTPASLITGFITEFGVISPPFEKNLKALSEPQQS